MIIDMDQFGELLAAWDDLSRACENVERIVAWLARKLG
jgi:hypothetical protein